MIKYIFTGNLNATINSNPPFPGKERHLLRAQIARITHGATLIPKGLLEVDEETGQEKYAEEFAMPGTPEEVKSLEIWGHQHPIILGVGRTTHKAPESMNEEEKEEYLGKVGETDAPVDRFRALNEDAPMTGLETAWLSKIVGDIQPYNQLPPKEGTVSYAVNVLKSLRWPGALTVSQSGKFANIYVGHGLKRGDVSFNPTEPPEVQKDPVDLMEQPEPTPLIAPELEPEPDTDKKPEDEEEQE
jgi:radial spoke head protein 4A